MDAQSLIREADQATSAGDIDRGVALLEQAAQTGEADVQLWLKIAALHRARAKPRLALNAVHEALKLQPLDFTALLLRASLLQRLGSAEAGEAWGNALAQKPAEALPPQMAPVIAEAERQHDAWVQERQARLTTAAA